MERADDLAVLARVVAEFNELASAGSGVDLGLATPCDDWSLADLLDHVVGGNRFTVAILEGATAEEAMATTMASFDDDRDPFLDLGTSTVQLDAAFREPGALEADCHHIAGTLPGWQVLRLRLHDLIVHEWDVAQTLHPPAALSSALEMWGSAELDDPASLTAKHFGLENSAEGTYLQRMGRAPAE